MSEQQKEELKIKDLLIKLQVLTNGLIDERKKSQSYLDRIKEYEESMQKKDSEIVELTKEKFDLKSKLTLEKTKQGEKKNDSYFSSFFKKPVDDSKVEKLKETINQLKYENKDLTQRLMEEKEQFDQQKIKFQTMITLQNQEMEKLKKESESSQKNKENEKIVENKNNELLIASHQEKIDSLNRKFNIEKDEYDKKLAELRNKAKEEKENNEILKQQLQQYKDAYEAKNVENIAMKKQLNDYQKQIRDCKQEVSNSKLQPRMFQVEKTKESGLVKQKKVMTITFQLNKNKNVCEVVFKRMKHGGKVKEDIVNILDISQFKVNDKKKDNVEIVFTVSLFNI